MSRPLPGRGSAPAVALVVGSVAAVALLAVVLVVPGALDRGPSDAGVSPAPSQSPDPSDGAAPADVQDRDAGAEPGATAPSGPAGATPAADPVRAFLEDYVDPDGRVVRRDQGGDTVSEGQAYALLLAVADEDEDTFRLVRSWTRENLLGADGLMAWRWGDGEVLDPNPATDADLDAAWALLLAGDVFDDPDLTTEGLDVAAAVLEQTTRPTTDGLALVAGPWVGEQAPWLVNPSYTSPSAVTSILAHGGDPRWSEVTTADRAVLDSLLAAAALPPDWAQVDGSGQVDIMPPPGGGDVTFGLDAARVPVRLAASCTAEDLDRAATLAGPLGGSGPAPGLRDLGGTATVAWTHPLAEVATAAALASDGDTASARQRLEAAAQLQADVPTYYGSAWLALGDVLLSRTDTPLRPCPAPVPEEDA